MWKSFLINLSVFDPTEIIPWRPETKRKTVDYLLEQIERYEGRTGIERVRDYYAQLLKYLRLGNYDAYLSVNGLTKQHIIDQIGRVPIDLLQ